MIDNELIVKAGAGNMDAIIALGNAYYDCKDGDEDREKAFSFFCKAVELEPDNVRAINGLANCYKNSVGVEKNIPKAMVLYRRAAELGFSDAQYNLAYELEQNNDPECVDWYQKAYENGNVDAPHILALIYDEGEIVPQDTVKYIEYLTKADEAGNIEATVDLACAYLKGEYIELNEVKGVELMQKAAAAGNAIAARNMSLAYKNGDGVNIDIEKSIEWAKKAAELGDAEKILEYALAYYFGEDPVAEDKCKAVDYFVLAANAGSATAMENLGICYYNGYGVAIDKNKAIAWYEKAAKIGSKKALDNIEELYSEVDPDTAESRYFELIKSVADDGYCDAMCRVHFSYRNGEGAEKNLEKAMYYLDKAVEDEYAVACYLKGLYFYNGDYGLEKDESKAVQLWTIAANDGHSRSAENLGVCYRNGDGVEQDVAKALEWYEKAKELGNMDACVRLGLAYDTDGFAGTDYAKAAAYYEEAHENDSVEGTYLLANMYEHGQGVSENAEKALELYKEAAAQGNVYAMEKAGQRLMNNAKFDEALEYFKRAKAAGSICADEVMLNLYNIEVAIGIETQEAVDFGIELAKQGNAKAQYMLGDIYLHGNIVQQDFEKAFYWYKESAERGNVEAMVDVAAFYSKGIGTEKNSRLEIKWLEKAAAEGSTKAKKFLADEYESGEKITADYKKAERLYREAIADTTDKDRYGTMCSLAIMYLKKCDMASLAFPLWKESAENGYIYSKYCLGMAYRYGWGTSKDKEKARHWLQQAAKSDDECAEKARESVMELERENFESESLDKNNNTGSSGGCYIATAVYGSYDCPQVWTLRRYRDNTLAQSWYGRAFIRLYYAVSPALVRWFGRADWFRRIWKPWLDRRVQQLWQDGVECTPYKDKK